MAEINLLKASFTGKLGETYGAQWKNIPVIRAIPFSKAPPTENQTKNVRAFEKLNRIASAIAQVGFANLGLSAKNLHNHNAVARWLKPAIKNHAFEPSLIEEVIPKGQDLFLYSFTFNFTTGILSIRLDLSESYIQDLNSYLFIVVFDDLAKVHFSRCIKLNNYQDQIILDSFGYPVYSLIAFTTHKTKNGYNSNNFIYRRGTGMQYSLEEQDTGDTWLDGSRIFQRTLTFKTGTLTATAQVAYQQNIENMLHCIRKEYYIPSSSTGIPSLSGQILGLATQSTPVNPSIIYDTHFPGVNQYLIWIAPSNTTEASTLSKRDVFITLRYTKKVI